MSRIAPFTGFGSDPSTSLKFDVLSDQGRTPDWTGGPRLIERTIPGSNRVNVRNTGRDPYRITLTLRLDSLTALNALDAMQGTSATLRYAWGVTKPLDGHHEHHAGEDYLAVPNVRLMRLSNVVRRPNGTVTVEAEFIKEAP